MDEFDERSSEELAEAERIHVKGAAQLLRMIRAVGVGSELTCTICLRERVVQPAPRSPLPVFSVLPRLSDDFENFDSRQVGAGG